MGWHYLFLANLVSAVWLFAEHVTRDNVPWYLTAILCLNFMLVMTSTLIMDFKNSQRDERIEKLEEELDKLKQEKGLNK